MIEQCFQTARIVEDKFGDVRLAYRWLLGTLGATASTVVLLVGV